MDFSIKVENLTKQFGDLVAVDKVNLAIKPGQICGFLGPNGAGKSTTLRMLCGLITPTAGQGQILGLDIVTDAEEIKSKIGYMSQRFSLYLDLTVLENLKFYAGVYGLKEEAAKLRIAELLEQLFLSEIKDSLAGTLSGGTKQRLALGCAILHDPKVLFLDEPTAGVDPVARRSFWNIIYSLSRNGTTIMVSTHYMDEAEQSDELVVIYGGKIIANGNLAYLRQHALKGELLEINSPEMLKVINLLHSKEYYNGVNKSGNYIHANYIGVESGIAVTAKLLNDNNIFNSDIKVVQPSLEEIFVSLISKEQVMK